ncbi:hypothetical protein [Massilia endophytica]|uniref:hypothetical protein n=1 Tax=Massilia endophytica TaxID=2899220 RepID=UPI001E33582F|nr:hypothetical protein [Massilia endophytica]UGQ48607.1 hypothetical protein LSQ66_09155 [Massilia endophytica]
MYARCLATLFALFVAAAASAAPAGIALRLADDGALQVDYTFPDRALVLPFANPDPQVWELVRKPHWRLVQDCAELRPEGIVRRRAGVCEQVTVRVQPGFLGLDRRFEPALPIGPDALSLHTRYYAIDGPMIWTVEPPRGGIAGWMGQVHGAAQEVAVAEPSDARQAAIDDTDLVLSRRPPARWTGAWAIASGLTAPLEAELRATSETLLAEYRHAFGEPVNGMPMLLFVGQPGSGETVLRPKGDVQDGTVRVTVAFSEGKLADKDRGVLRVFLAHELFHLWHGRRFNAAGEPWLGEGNADWIGLNLMHRLGWMNDSVYLLLLEQAFNQCALAIGEQPWRAAPQRQGGILPYRCGLAFHAIAFEASRRAGNTAGPLEQWRAILGGSDALREEDFFGWYERPDFAGGRIAPLRRLLASETPFAEGLLAAMRSAGVSFEMAPTLSWLPSGARRNCAQGGGSRSGAFDVNCPGAFSMPGGFIHLGVVGTAKSRLEIRQ